MSVVVYKLGGSTVADAERIRRTLAALELDTPSLLVVSAPAGITDRLIAAAATDQRSSRAKLCRHVGDHFVETAASLLEADQADRFAARVRGWLDRHADRSYPARLLARGELWNAELIAGYLRRENRPACAVDARQFVRGDGDDRSAHIIDTFSSYVEGGPSVPVITGFIGRDAAGRTVTLGRDGSDYTAALVAEKIGAERVDFVTDTRGIRTADPARLGAVTKRIRVLSFRAARTVAALGAGVLHARTIGPLERGRIPARIYRPDRPDRATLIEPDAHWPSGGPGLFSSAGIPPRVLVPLVDREAGLRLARRLGGELSHRAACPVLMLDAELHSIEDLHARLYDAPRVCRLVVVGRGRVGQALLRALGRDDLLLRYTRQLAITVEAVAHSEGVRFESGRSPLKDSAAYLASLGPDQCDMVVDVTASQSVAELHAGWTERRLRVVTANKLALAGSQEVADRLLDADNYSASSTVGAGLPMIDALARSVLAGTAPDGIRGVLSGSLNFLLWRMHCGDSFDSALAQAIHQGLVEPDPRADLEGHDAARKLVILARQLGARLDLSAVDRRDLLEGGSPAALEYRVDQARERGERILYVARLDTAGARVGPECVRADDPLTGPDVTNTLIASWGDDDRLVIRGPGSGPEITAEAVLRDIVLQAIANAAEAAVSDGGPRGTQAETCSAGALNSRYAGLSLSST